ncbi:hypothetical protein [Oceanobacillus sp. CF4.6]|uniref:LptM family lipoprotein n=1 Tax=Oceanobacillus sp. CF4.6 TaxID=3373080 RepID=UPI003EE80EAC
MKRIIFFLLTITTIFVISACGSEDNSAEVDLTMETEAIESTLTVSGETNLPNGTLLTYEVSHLDDFEKYSTGEIEVIDGDYHTEIDISDWPEGDINVWLAFQTILGTTVEQPKEVIEKYGEMGENLEGDNVTDGDMKRIELEETVSK